LWRVVHLHRRVGFAASWRSCSATSLTGRSVPSTGCWRKIDHTHAAGFRGHGIAAGECRVTSASRGRLKAWWVYRMALRSRPAGEKLTLLWHDHFATSNAKVNNPRGHAPAE